MWWRHEWVMVLALLLATSGCLKVRTDSQPVDIFQLSLHGEKPIREAAVAGGEGPVLLVGLPRSEPGFDQLRIAYRTRAYELKYFSASQWADTPGHMLSPLVVEAFERRGSWSAVVAAPTVLRADYRLDLSDLVLVQEFLEVPSRVRLSWKARIVRLQDGVLVGAERFEALRPSPSEDAYGGVLAANKALAQLLEDMAMWAERCVRKPREVGC